MGVELCLEFGENLYETERVHTAFHDERLVVGDGGVERWKIQEELEDGNH